MKQQPIYSRMPISRIIFPAVVALVLVLFCNVIVAQEDHTWKDLYQQAEAAYNSRQPYSCVPLFEDLIARIMKARETEDLSQGDLTILKKSLEYLANTFFNRNEQEKASDAFLKLIEVDPSYQLNAAMESSKVIRRFDALKQENLGSLTISGAPKEVSVKMDGHTFGATDLENVPVLRGEHSIELEKPGFQSEKRTVTIEAGAFQQIHFSLISLPETPPAHIETGIATAQDSPPKEVPAEPPAESTPEPAPQQRQEPDPQALLSQGDVLLTQGDRAGAASRFQDARKVFLERNDQDNAARVQMKLDGLFVNEKNEAIGLLQHGYEHLTAHDYVSATKEYEQALNIARQIGDQSLQANALMSVGFLEFYQKEMPSAKAHFEEALSLARDTGDKQTQALALCNLAAVYFGQGDSIQANSLYDQSVALYREIGVTPRPRPW